MYMRQIRPSTTCLYSAASMLDRSASAASHSLAAKPSGPLPLSLDFLAVLALAIERPLPCTISCREPGHAANHRPDRRPPDSLPFSLSEKGENRCRFRGRFRQAAGRLKGISKCPPAWLSKQ